MKSNFEHALSYKCILIRRSSSWLSKYLPRWQPPFLPGSHDFYYHWYCVQFCRLSSWFWFTCRLRVFLGCTWTSDSVHLFHFGLRYKSSKSAHQTSAGSQCSWKPRTFGFLHHNLVCSLFHIFSSTYLFRWISREFKTCEQAWSAHSRTEAKTTT